MKLYIPKLEELTYRKHLLSDKKTMEFFEGPVKFNKDMWPSWYKQWFHDDHYFYRYIYDETLDCFIGEVSYQYEESYNAYVLNIIIEYKYRRLGKGKEALELLCKEAKNNGLRFLYDDIDASNPAIQLFKDAGFKEAWQRENIIMLRKRL